jgi:dTDP-4-amino-4,6-dideoxygalactose transaminase
MIKKKASNLTNFKREWIYTDSARQAWTQIIDKFKILNPHGKILLPSYIGWSPNEGSGILDSVLDSGLDYGFYELGLYLEININDLKEKVLSDKNQLVLIVNYFGFIDKNYEIITEWLKGNNIFFIEDCAHAWLTDLIGGLCGRKGSFAFYSLHKLLPVASGGIRVNNTVESSERNLKINPFFELSYDLIGIYNTRRNNYEYLCNLLINISQVEVIYKKLENGICPQSLPVIVLNSDREKLYFEMNKLGFGMVSLYHTMIDSLLTDTSPAASILSKKIINFPIHQDIDKEDLDKMVLAFKKILDA